jgi:hypothetical protein
MTDVEEILNPFTWEEILMKRVHKNAFNINVLNYVMINCVAVKHVLQRPY